MWRVNKAKPDELAKNRSSASVTQKAANLELSREDSPDRRANWL